MLRLHLYLYTAGKWVHLFFFFFYELENILINKRKKDVKTC